VRDHVSSTRHKLLSPDSNTQSLPVLMSNLIVHIHLQNVPTKAESHACCQMNSIPATKIFTTVEDPRTEFGCALSSKSSQGGINSTELSLTFFVISLLSSNRSDVARASYHVCVPASIYLVLAHFNFRKFLPYELDHCNVLVQARATLVQSHATLVHSLQRGH
jgi:hypothetical protein